jgi:lipoprotein-releasing system ATP-binding protein
MTVSPSAAASTASRSPRDTESRASGPETDPSPLIQVRNLRKTYVTARGSLDLFKDLNLSVEAGELVAIVGQSGAGKSTLLHILGALDAASSGTVYCASINVATLTPRDAAAFRNREIGYVWQFHYLLPEFTAQENVAMPLLARRAGNSGVPGDRSSSLGWNSGAPADKSSSLGWKSDAMAKAAHWLREVGLGDRCDHRPGELSGGEQQRVALARALVTQPRILLADEPTGDLDSQTARLVFELIERLHRSHHLTSILVTHNLELAERCTRVLRLDGGQLKENPTAPSEVT